MSPIAVPGTPSETPTPTNGAIPAIPGPVANPLFSLSNRTVAITGGGRGLGIVLTSAVLEAGGDVACLDLLPAPSAEEWVAVQKLAASRGLQASYIQCDITDEAATQMALEKIAAVGLERGMPLKGAITCAGIQQMVPALEYPVDLWRKMLDVKYVSSLSFLNAVPCFRCANGSSVVGTFIPAKHCARIFKEQGTGGSIVMIASMSGQIANRVCSCHMKPPVAR